MASSPGFSKGKKKNSASYVVSSLMAVSAVVDYLIATHFPF
jgi:hypothetical protein